MYQAEVSRTNPSAFMFVIDQSGSMDEPFGEKGVIRKEQFLADVLNHTLNDLVLRATKGVNDVRDWYELAAIGYGGTVQSAWGGKLAGRILVPLSAVKENPLRVEQRMKKGYDGAGGMIEEEEFFPIWLDPVAQGGTPMHEALMMARDLLAAWVEAHPTAYPPIVFNITDGRPTGSTLAEVAAAGAAIRDLATQDGQVMFANVHISGKSRYPVRYPRFDDPLPGLGDNATLLRDMSSPLIAPWVGPLSERTGLDLTTANSCSVYDAGPEDLIWLLDIGTRQDNLR